MIRKLQYLLTLILIPLLLCSCSSQPSKFYVLNPISTTSKSHGKITRYIGLDKIHLAQYLQQNQIIVRTNRNQLHLNEFQRWAEPLRENIQEVLKNNLQQLLRHTLVLNYPWKSTQKINNMVSISINKFEANTRGYCTLIASYTIKNDKDEITAAYSHLRFRQKINPKNYDSIVAGMNNTLNQLSRSIARHLR